MKKIIAIFISVFVCVSLLNMTCFAEDVTEYSVDEDIAVEAEEEVTEEADESKDSTWDDLFSRVFEFSAKYRLELLELTGSSVIVLVASLLEKRRKKDADDTMKDIGIVKGASTNTERSQGAVVDVINSMITGYNKMRDSYEKYEGVEDDRNRLLGAVFVQNTAVLEILMSVYVNNKNLPQGVKDLVTLRYTNAQKALGNDDLLMSVVAAVREKINAEETPVDQTEEDEENEVAEV